MYIHICICDIMWLYVCVYLYIVYMGVRQNKGISGSYNRPSTANQPRSQRCQSREGSVVCDAILRRESSKHCCISQYLETWREPGPTQAGLTIAEQSRINREPIADFIDITLYRIYNHIYLYIHIYIYIQCINIYIIYIYVTYVCLYLRVEMCGAAPCNCV